MTKAMEAITNVLSDFQGNLTRLQNELIKQEQVECPVIHTFSPGLYIREVMIPAGTFAIGHYQKKEHLNIFLKGKVRMLNDDGSVVELTAPMIFTGKPGRKCGLIIEDMVWMNVYPTDETNVEKLEEMFLDKEISFQEHERIRLLAGDRETDREDYKKMLVEYGFTEEIARRQSENEEDQIPFPPGSYKVKLADSNIEGKGLYATASIEPGEAIAPARLNGKRTPAGRYTNHSANPNAEMVKVGDDFYLVAIHGISGCHGGRNGDEITIDYRKCMQLNGVKKRGAICHQ